MDDALKKMTEQVEYLFLKKLVTGLRGGNISPVLAKESAQAFLKIEPFQNFEDAKAKIQQFVATYPLLEELKNYIDAYHYEQKVDAVIEKMQSYIGQNNLDEALKVAQNEGVAS